MQSILHSIISPIPLETLEKRKPIKLPRFLKLTKKTILNT